MQPKGEIEFRLKPTLRGMSDYEVLEDLAKVALHNGRDTVTMEEYNASGKGHATTLIRRFGSWPKSLELAGLQPSRSKIGISDEELFDNLKEVWISLGRQPKYLELRLPQSCSRFSEGTYSNRFGSWSKALRAFVEWVEAEPDQGISGSQTGGTVESQPQPLRRHRAHRTKRIPSERLRFRILLRDGFVCTACGASPVRTRGTELHVDHIVPWSRGGETVEGNLTTKCQRCNLGKGNMPE